ncbi:hypothetical protein CGRA01v4_10702 [Colletotrichum graminicola]|nr:hypothetical protein CGRA01v4_10702 [Colletotrichum graminicola]
MGVFNGRALFFRQMAGPAALSLLPPPDRLVQLAPAQPGLWSSGTAYQSARDMRVSVSVFKLVTTDSRVVS